ncbi:MAG TPA: sugar phosphate isomerase/epimerase family protein [Bryobacteraceae bacterium]|nr:sugar phosphate isomerase/epimerase family protein [Bryobacteraceae bacterium]
MAKISRRTLLQFAPFAGLGGRIAGAARTLTIGVTDWNLRLGANPDALPLAARIGFEGIQISFGRRLVNDKLPVDDPEIISRYLSLSSEHKIPINGTCVDKLHDNGLKSDRLAIRWVLDSIRLTSALKTKVLLLPFFGKWAIQDQDEGNRVGDALREIAPEAERAGVILGIEDTISAENNVRIMDRAKSRNVSVYYDIGNSTQAGFDVVKEIRWLGKERICQFHLKDNPHYLGEGAISLPRVIEAIRDIQFTGAANLETDTHEGSTVEADMRKNLAYIRQVMG